MSPVKYKLDWNGTAGTYTAEQIETTIDLMIVCFSVEITATGSGYLGENRGGPAFINVEAEINITIQKVLNEYGEELDPVQEDLDYLIYNIKDNISYE